MNFENLPENWKVVRLGRVAEIVMGQSPPSSTYNTEGLGLPFLQGKFEFGERHPTPIKWCSNPLKIAHKGDILISVRAPVGDVNISPCDLCIGRGLAAVRPSKDKVNMLYLFFFLKNIKHELEKLGGGSTFSAITKDILTNLVIPLPPLPEQKRIVEILNFAEDLIKKQKETIALIDKILMAKFLEMFGDPVTNPKGWEVRRLDEVILNMRHGISRKGIKKSLKNPLKCLRPSNINKQCKVNLSDVRIVKFSERDFNRAGLTKGELVISHLNGSIDHVGKCILFVFEDKWIFDSNLLAIKLNPQKINSYYSYWVWRYLFIQEKFKEIAVKTTGGQYLLTNERLRVLQIPLPPIELQKQFAQIVEEFEKKREEMQKTLEILESLFKLLQKKAFTGELTAEWREQNNVEWEIPQITERQAVLLASIYYHQAMVQKPAMVTVAMKSAFLLQQEAGLNLGYDFIPYKYGPFSKEVYEDIEELEKNLLVERVKPKKDLEMTEIRLIEEFKDWTEKIIDSLPEDIKEIVKAYIEKYGKMELNELLDYVYAKYPEYAVKSKRKRRRK